MTINFKLKRGTLASIAFVSIVICWLGLFLSFRAPVYTGANGTPGGGIVLTFDDEYVSDWYEADNRLSKYGWKATFFVSGFSRLDAKDIEKLKILETNGHEIGSHGANHLDAVKFVDSYSIEDYVKAEIIPSIEAMSEAGLSVSSFAYPFGARNERIDKGLLGHFSMIRGTVYGNRESLRQGNFWNGSRVVFGLGIDTSYGNDIAYLLELLEFAKDHNRIGVYYGHRIGQDDSKDYTTGLRTLEAMCEYAVEHGMRFMTIRELGLRQKQEVSKEAAR
jgi:peptidoglycan-N-acetylglucosamine deacetylase